MYTSPKDWSTYNTLSTTYAYKKIMKSNVDLELSSNSWDISIQKTLNTSKAAIFAHSAFFDWDPAQILSKYPKDLPCMVRLE